MPTEAEVRELLEESRASPDLHLPAGTWDEGHARERRLDLLRAARGCDLGELVLETGEHEFAVLPLAGSLTVDVDGRRFELAGRESVFKLRWGD